MRQALRGALGLGLACLLCAQAGADEKWQRDLNQYIQRGQVTELEQLLDDARLESTAKSADDWYELVGRLEKYSPFLIRVNAEDFGTLLDRILEHATRLQAENEGNAEYHLAWACATAVRCRLLVHAGHKKAQPEWRTAADCVAKLYADDGATAEYACRAAVWLGEAAAARGEKAKELLARAKEILHGVATRGTAESRARLALGEWYVTRAHVAAVRKSKSDGKKAVLEGLAFLKPHVGCANPDPEHVTLHSKLLAENWLGRFGVKETMRLQQVKPKGHGITFLIPESTEWRLIDPERSQSGVVEQVMYEGLPRRQYYMQSWKPDGKIYVDRDKTLGVAVANTKNLAAAFVATLDQYCGIVEVTKRHKARKAKLHKDFEDVWHIAVEGLRTDGRYLKTNAYYFTPKKSKRVYNLTVNEFQPETTPDAVAEFVLMNVQRTRRK